MIPGLVCENCEFYYRLSDQCRESGPRPLPVPVGPGDFRILGMWPAVRASDWCGKHSKLVGAVSIVAPGR